MPPNPKGRVLIIEDARFFSRLLRHQIENQLGFEVVCAETLKEACGYLEENPSFFLALVDLNLPDAPDGEAVGKMTRRGIPVIVFTANFSPQKRSESLALGVIDYVIKSTPSSFEYVIKLVRRVYKNRSIHALVLDDSPVSQRYTSMLLSRFQFSVQKFDDGLDALQALKTDPRIKLIITGYQMAKMDGILFTSEVRRRFPTRRVAIIGISSKSNDLVSARFIKSGANDFLDRPFGSEELLCRITQNLDLMEKIEELEWAASHDHLTKLNNRRSFFALSKSLLLRKNNARPYTLAMIDIDHFKRINDLHGHFGGDIVLQRLSQIFLEHLPPPAIIARFGGEEFCALLQEPSSQVSLERFESLRAAVESEKIYFEDNPFPVSITISIGLQFAFNMPLDRMILNADSLLYLSKRQGRNCITRS